jgi:molybdenum cofactor guanylyltransferase
VARCRLISSRGALPHLGNVVKTLGAIIAGGKAKRFGSDKGAALLNGRALIDLVADGLRPQVDQVIIVGRPWPGMLMLEDRPSPDLGPLGGLCAALHYGAYNGFDRVITAGCDVLPIPALSNVAGDGPFVIEGQYLLGMWPVNFADALDHHLNTQSHLSMRHWLSASGARQINAGLEFHNLNRPADLAVLRSIFPPPRS